MAWEWHRMACGGFGLAGWLTGAVTAAAALLAVHHPAIAGLSIVAVALASAVLVRDERRSWAGFGALYVGLPTLALVWLRGDPHNGGAVVVWLLLVVWATDIGAYASGRLIGGPLLLPRVSPKKTWSGLLGGMMSAAIVAVVVCRVLGQGDPLWIGIAGAVTAVVAQIGDLFESWVKRRWGVKDSSAIIPGHGGVMDRVDGLLSAGVAVAILTALTGKAILAWQ
jgi:phosphatidate cytidylyltransferase